MAHGREASTIRCGCPDPEGESFDTCLARGREDNILMDASLSVPSFKAHVFTTTSEIRVDSLSSSSSMLASRFFSNFADSDLNGLVT